MTIITPKNAIELVLAKKTKEAKFQPYETATQKWCLRISLGSFCIGIVLALSTHIWENKYFLLGALLSVLASSLFAMAYQIASIVPELEKLRNVEREISKPFLAVFNDDIDLISELSQTYEVHHLSFAKANFTLMAKQLRERIGILVGALEKVGLIPIATSAYFAFIKFRKDGLEPFNGIDWVFAAFAFLYILAVRMTGAAQWMEKISEIYEQAIALKSKRES
ncbi:hypothetical protein [Uliginosibacterium sp. TH139]|uniref:hypothetical protein n=1 Tax=Uliginosibacterium sp. TH139 TaxID=2067453 RepID=UPI000C7BC68E|nr:hypothetical protein [Uliginosibacterium sp. TH139]PLK50666.1 hypothetical protein C0V76_02300 [Uliginosibacterium sp. TH139]